MTDSSSASSSSSEEESHSSESDLEGPGRRSRASSAAEVDPDIIRRLCSVCLEKRASGRNPVRVCTGCGLGCHIGTASRIVLFSALFPFHHLRLPFSDQARHIRLAHSGVIRCARMIFETECHYGSEHTQPTGDDVSWTCDRCAAGEEASRSACAACHGSTGIMKQTHSESSSTGALDTYSDIYMDFNFGRHLFCSMCGDRDWGNITVTGWAHLVCAIYHPFLAFENGSSLSGITGCERIPSEYFKLQCTLCSRKGTSVVSSLAEFDPTMTSHDLVFFCTRVSVSSHLFPWMQVVRACNAKTPAAVSPFIRPVPSMRGWILRISKMRTAIHSL